MISALAPTGSGFGVGDASGRAQVNREEFLQILVTELSHQDPMDPLDNSEFLQQLVGLQNLEQTAALTDALNSFQQFMQMSSASSLIGRTVKAIDVQGWEVQGKVDKVVLEGGNVLLQVGNSFASVNGITEIL
jgi:flagellar basal-body rod modification protein FlgD